MTSCTLLKKHHLVFCFDRQHIIHVRRMIEIVRVQVNRKIKTAQHVEREVVKAFVVRLQVDDAVRAENVFVPAEKNFGGEALALAAFLRLRVGESYPYLAHFTGSKKIFDVLNLYSEEGNV